MTNQLPPQTVKRIEKDAEAYIKDTAKFNAYVKGATAEAQRAKELVEALRKIDAISFHKNEWEEMAQIQSILKQALKNYQQ